MDSRIFRKPSVPDILFQDAQKRAEHILASSKVNPAIVSTLNKLTPVNLAKLQPELLNLATENEANLLFLVEKIFQKACIEKKYTNMWAGLCKYLSVNYSNYESLKADNEAKLSNKFKSALLNMSQTLFDEFENLIEIDDLVKKKRMGNMKFIGELFKTKIIPAKTILKCLNSLLADNGACDDKIEGATILIMSSGAKCERLGESVREIFNKIDKLTKNPAVSQRVKFLLQVICI